MLGKWSSVNENLRGIVLFGFAFLVFGLVMMVVRRNANDEMAQLSVTVDDVLVVKVEPEEKSSGRRKRTVYRPYFKFTDQSGNEVVAKSMVTFPDNHYPEGTRVTVRYDPNDPQNRAVVEGSGYESETTDFLSIVVVAFGALWIVVGLVIILVVTLVKREKVKGYT